MLHHRRPGPLLSSFVEQFWFCEGYQAAHRAERVLPSGSFSLIVDLACGAPPIVSGMRAKSVVIETAALRSVLGVVFRPGGARPFFEAPSDEFYNRDQPLDGVWRSGVGTLVERLQEAETHDRKFALLESALTARFSRSNDPHPAVRHALCAFEGAPHLATVAGVARDSGLSRRRLGELFREQVGMTPKLYCRLRRFRQVVEQAAKAGEIDWADVAIGGGYSDQSHMAHEFREFSGITPCEYLAAQRPHVNHVPVD